MFWSLRDGISDHCQTVTVVWSLLVRKRPVRRLWNWYGMKLKSYFPLLKGVVCVLSLVLPFSVCHPRVRQWSHYPTISVTTGRYRNPCLTRFSLLKFSSKIDKKAGYFTGMHMIDSDPDAVCSCFHDGYASARCPLRFLSNVLVIDIAL